LAWLGLIALVFGLAACTTSRYSMEHDAIPQGKFDASKVPNAKPIWEPLSRRGNQTPYEVRGKQYTILPSADGYEEVGVASWYGLKFHGELTSNGEIYNMYSMSAAHKTLPLPAYLRVTNLENQKSIIVRVNDRGPFHTGRIIDLSYAAAKKLEYDKQGTARVKLEVITVPKVRVNSSGNTRGGESGQLDRISNFIQVAAYANRLAAESVYGKLMDLVGRPDVFIAKSPNQKPAIYRVRVGPLDEMQEAESLVSKIKEAGIGQPILIKRAVLAKDR